MTGIENKAVVGSIKSSMPTSNIPKTENLKKALVYMTASGLAFAMMAVFGKWLSAEHINQTQIIFLRALFNLIFVVFFLSIAKDNPFKPFQPLLYMRGITGTVSLVFYFYALLHLPLPIASLLNQSTPVFVLILSRFFLKESLTVRQYFFVFVAFIGFIILLNPTGLSDLFQHSNTEFLSLTSDHSKSILIALTGALFSAISYMAIRVATQTHSANGITFYFTFTSSLVLSIPAFLAWQSLNFDQWGLVIGMGLSASLGQFFMTSGYREARAGIVATMGLLTTLFATGFGILLFNEDLMAIQWAGLFTVAMSVFFLSR